MSGGAGNFFEDFHVGQVIRHATPRTVTAGDVAGYDRFIAQVKGSSSSSSSSSSGSSSSTLGNNSESDMPAPRADRN